MWDISTHHCLKTIYLQFPCQQPGRIPDHGNFPFLLLSPPLSEHAHLLVGCKDYLALLPLSEMRRGEARWLTDEGREATRQGGPAVSCALYSSTLRLVVTGHVDSSVSLWDVGTGRWRLQISNAHGEEEVTCMTLDSSHRRLITGSCSGTIKVQFVKKTEVLVFIYFICMLVENETRRPPSHPQTRCGTYSVA